MTDDPMYLHRNRFDVWIYRRPITQADQVFWRGPLGGVKSEWSRSFRTKDKKVALDRWADAHAAYDAEREEQHNAWLASGGNTKPTERPVSDREVEELAATLKIEADRKARHIARKEWRVLNRQRMNLSTVELSPEEAAYLFRQDGLGVSLGVSHGSTRFDGGDFKPRSREEADALMIWARGLLSAEAKALGFGVGVDLGSGEKLSRAYERTTAFAKVYPADAVPSDEELAEDAVRAVSLLGQLYRAVELGRAPEAEPPEIVEAQAALTEIARPSSRPRAVEGQGFGLTGPERRLVESHAMTLAHAWLSQSGFTNIRDVHVTHSCDYLALRDGAEHYVEVKGTTAGFGKVLLTANEVALHRANHPFNLLIVVHDINLLELRTKAEGGQVRVFDGWDVASAQLTALSYSCQLTL